MPGARSELDFAWGFDYSPPPIRNRSGEGSLMRISTRLDRVIRSAAVVLGLAAAPPVAEEQPGKLIVSEVVILGNRYVSREIVRGLLRTRPGQEYIPEIVQEDVRTLDNLRHFGSVIAGTGINRNGKIRVYFIIPEYPGAIEKIEYRGAYAIKKDDIEKAAGLWLGTTLNPLENQAACRRIVARYNEEGYPLATCDLVKGGAQGDTEVIFNITEGHKRGSDREWITVRTTTRPCKKPADGAEPIDILTGLRVRHPFQGE
jgi:outer membrane protein assembly factor BamA